MSFAKILFPEIKGLYTYYIPENMQIKEGDIVLAPLKERKKFGVVWEIKEEKDFEGDVKNIEEKTEFFLPEKLRLLALKMSEYYFEDISLIIRYFMPPLFEVKRRYFLKNKDFKTKNEKELKIIEILKKAKKPLLSRSIKKRAGFDPSYYFKKFLKKDIIGISYYTIKKPSLKKFIIEPFEKIDIPKDFTVPQKKIYEKICENMERFGVHLIHGVTGSGKTFIYLKLAERILNMNKSLILLVPEISLIPQVYFLFNKYFGENIILWGSALSKSERLYFFKEAISGEPKIVIGPRSAIFTPLKNTGMIIIDEEQENSYKEDERAPYYHAREVARIRCEIENIPLVLGSATPETETFYFAKENKYFLYTLKERIKGYKFPEIEILDLRKEKFPFFLSAKIIEEIERNVKEKKQVILFLNRRGFAHFMQCMDCGYVFKCKNCDIQYVYHKDVKKLVCHFCSHEINAPDLCPNCKGTDIKYSGYGTEKIEEGLKEIFPSYRIIRMDLDTTRKKREVFEIFKKFKNKEADILLGTQMIIKGFDFPEVSLVGILYADLSLNLPDFRAREKTFITLNQVIGRARKGGKVILQTMDPENPVIRYINPDDYEKFYEEELAERKAFLYPPFSHLLLIEVKDRDRNKAMEKGEEIKKIISGNFEILGPSFAPIEKIKNFYRVRILLKSKERKNFESVFEKLENMKKKYPLKVEINPYYFL
ncbi:MAG: primosomal protein N' [candidate division WOR-3 bacterium]